MVSQPEISAQYMASREIDDLLDSDKRSRDLLGRICRAMLAHQGTDVGTLSNSAAVSQVLSPRESGLNQRFYAAVFLRLLATFPYEVHDLNNNHRVGVTKLLDQLPQVSKALKIDKKSQGHQRRRAFEQAASTAEESLAEALTPPTSLAAFDHVRGRIMRVYASPLVEAIAKPFLPNFLSKRAISNILAVLHEHVSASQRLRMAKYAEVKETLTEVLNDCTRYDTHYVRKFFRPFFIAVIKHLTDDFESSPFSPPASLSLKELGKKYPFTVSDADVRLTFAVENNSRGIALDVELSIETDGNLSLPSPSQFLDQIDSGDRLEPVEFRASVVKPTDKSVLVEWTLTWRDGDGSSRRSNDLIELQAQPSDIPWEDLRHAEPYSLEPVTNAEDLIGRSEQTRLLISKIKAPSVGSFCIYGQRRVGKTSVVATLEDMPELQGVTILNLETGHFIVADAHETINNLGRTICTELLDRNPKLTDLTAPNFTGALAPLTPFLKDAFRQDPSLRLVIVLDEFDELPPEIYRRGEVSHAFFMTLRSLSARPRLGFILVGGERMAEILSTQGGALNKFRSLRIDYLERDSHWSD